jgi:hypothetical protein
MTSARLFSGSQLSEQLAVRVMKLNNDINRAVDAAEKMRLQTDLIKTIEEISFPNLVAIAEAKIEINDICKSVVLNDYWRNSLESLTPTEEAKSEKPVSEFKHKSIATIHPFDMLKGLYFYNLFLKLLHAEELSKEEKYKKAEDCLRHSAEYGYFSALNALCIEGMLKLKHNNPSLDMLQEVMKFAMQAAKLHRTPGYFLLSNVCHELSRYTKPLLEDANQVIKKMYFTEAYKALCKAEKLEPVSKNMIHNAYKGKSIWQAANNQVTSWLDAKEKLVARSNGLLQPSDMMQAMKQINGETLNEKSSPRIKKDIYR